MKMKMMKVTSTLSQAPRNVDIWELRSLLLGIIYSEVGSGLGKVTRLRDHWLRRYI
jgi:hypothetical protein